MEVTMKRAPLIILAALATAFLGAGSARAQTPANPVPNPTWSPHGQWTSKLDSEFNGTAPGAPWNVTWWNNVQYSGFTACPVSSHVTESHGYLRLRLTHTSTGHTCRSSSTPLPYLTGNINTHGRYYFGDTGVTAAQARVYVPCNAAGQVIAWPSFFANSNDFAAEQDIMEDGAVASGVTGGSATNLHYAGGSNGFVARQPFCGWHTYGSQWNAKAQTYRAYWDGVRLWGPVAFPTSAGEPDYLSLNYQEANPDIQLPVGSSSTLRVDWVRTWVCYGTC
jgi:hypothetical protein